MASDNTSTRGIRCNFTLVVALQWFGSPNRALVSFSIKVMYLSTKNQVLADQPIINPTPNIAEFRYIDLKGEGIMARIDFRGKRADDSIVVGIGK